MGTGFARTAKTAVLVTSTTLLSIMPLVAHSAHETSTTVISSTLVQTASSKGNPQESRNQIAIRAVKALVRFANTLDSRARNEYLSLMEQIIKDDDFYKRYAYATINEEYYRGNIDVNPKNPIFRNEEKRIPILYPPMSNIKKMCDGIWEVETSLKAEFVAYLNSPDREALQYFGTLPAGGDWSEIEGRIKLSLSTKYDNPTYNFAASCIKHTLVEMERDHKAKIGALTNQLKSLFGKDGMYAGRLAVTLGSNLSLERLRSLTGGRIEDWQLSQILAFMEQKNLIPHGGWQSLYGRYKQVKMQAEEQARLEKQKAQERQEVERRAAEEAKKEHDKLVKVVWTYLGLGAVVLIGGLIAVAKALEIKKRKKEKKEQEVIRMAEEDKLKEKVALEQTAKLYIFRITNSNMLREIESLVTQAEAFSAEVKKKLGEKEGGELLSKAGLTGNFLRERYCDVCGNEIIRLRKRVESATTLDDLRKISDSRFEISRKVRMKYGTANYTPHLKLSTRTFSRELGKKLAELSGVDEKLFSYHGYG